MITKGDDSGSSCCVTVPTPFLFHYKRALCIAKHIASDGRDFTPCT